MSYDQFGRPVGPMTGQQHYPVPAPAYGYTAIPGAESPAEGAVTGGPSARTMMPTVGQMGGQGHVPWVRFPFFPTAPFYSTNPSIGHQIRFYSTGINGNQSDVTLGSETIRVIQFDIPCRVIAINGSCAPTTNAGIAGPFVQSMNPLDLFLFRMEYTNGDRLHISERLGSTVVGSSARPGELGGTGFTVDQGAGLIIGITPLNSLSAVTPNYRVDITLHCLEIRGSSNFVGGR
jgi:hypothetical protein